MTPRLAIGRRVLAHIVELLAGDGALMTTVAPESLYRFIYAPRVLGMALAGLSAGSALYEGRAPPWSWALLVLTALVWPHDAYLRSRRCTNPVVMEQQNLMLDSVFIGMWIPLMHFNLLPSVVIPMITTFDKGYTVYRRLWLYSLLGLVTAAAAFSLLFPSPPQLTSSTPVVLCTLPLIFFYTWFNSYRGARLLRIVMRQHWALDEKHRTDSQTGLNTRAHWMECANLAFQEDCSASDPPCLLLIDIDHFKSINDTYGHTVGDEVIGEVGRVVREHVRKDDIAGRFGGDEIAVIVLNANGDEANEIAERIRQGIAALRLASAPRLRLSASIGLAVASPRNADLRAWIDDADAALYHAKHSGRDRVIGLAAQET